MTQRELLPSTFKTIGRSNRLWTTYRPSRSRGHALPAASAPFTVSRAPSAGTSTVQRP